MSSDRDYKRKRFFDYSVKRTLQLRMLFKVWAIVLVSLLVAGAIFYFYSNINVGTSYRMFHVKATNFLDFLFPVLLSGVLASLIVGTIVSLFFPHAFAGPLDRMENELIDIGKGNLRKEIKLRKGSEVKDLAGAINTMIVGLRDGISVISDISGKIGNLIEQASAESSEETLQKIKTASGDLQEAVGRFKL